MPINGLTYNAQLRFERLGKIYLGIRVEVRDKKTGRVIMVRQPDGTRQPKMQPTATE